MSSGADFRLPEPVGKVGNVLGNGKDFFTKTKHSACEMGSILKVRNTNSDSNKKDFFFRCAYQ